MAKSQPKQDPRVQLIDMLNEDVSYRQIKDFLKIHPRLQRFYDVTINAMLNPRENFQETGELQLIETYIQVGMYNYAGKRIDDLRKRLDALEKMAYDRKTAEPTKAR